MPHAIGRKLTLSSVRRFFRDLLHFTRRVPAVPISRRMRLADVAAAREVAVPHPSWRAVFLKAFAHVSSGNPLLRRCHLSLPWPHAYEHSETVAVVRLERPSDGEAETAFVSLPGPQTLRLSEIDVALQDEKHASTMPHPGQLVKRIGLGCSGRCRTRLLGTFGMSSTPLQPLPLFALTVHHGPVDERGEAIVCLTYDDRVLDSFDAARALGEMEQVLHDRILTELRYIESLEAA